MIWFRRSLAIVLALVFVALYIPLLAIFRVNSTALNPDFYVDRLHEADVYNYTYDVVLPAALDDIQADSDSATAENIAVFKSEAVKVARESLPPEWLETQAEPAITESMRYLLGDIDSFEVVIPVADRVREMAAGLKESLHKPEVFDAVYNAMISWLADGIAGNEGESPFSTDRPELEAALRTAMPPDWTLEQLDNFVDQVVPWLTGDRQGFQITIDLSQRLDALQTIIVDALKTTANYDNFMRTISESVSGGVVVGGYALPVGLFLTQDEVLGAMKTALTVEWYESTVTSLTAQVMSYIKGEQPELEAVVSLKGRKQAIGSALAGLAERKLCTYYDSLPVATPQQIVKFLANPPEGQLPLFKLPLLSCNDIESLLHINMKDQVGPVLAAAVPDQWTVTPDDFKDVLGGRQNLLDEARDWVSNGLVINSNTLRDTLGDNYEVVEDIRDNISKGVVFTEQDLRKTLLGDSYQRDGASAEDFDRYRGYVGTFRHWKLVLWLIPALVLLAIGFLGGRHWSSRLMWASGVMLLTALVTFLAFGPVFSSVGQPHIDTALSHIAVESPVAAQAIDVKIIEVAGDSVSSFVSGMKNQALMFLITSAALLVISVGMRVQERRDNGDHGDDNWHRRR